MKIVNRKTAELIPYAKNTRTHSEQQINQIATSIRQFGWTNPILIKSDNTIIAGHGRLLAAKQENIDTVPCIVLDHLSDQQARALVIADNKLALNAGWDTEMLLEELNELKNSDIDFDVVGFSDDELNSLVNSINEYNNDDDDNDDADDNNIDGLKSVQKPMLVMKIGKYQIPLTEEEYNSLIDRLNDYIKTNQVTYGFAGQLLGT